MCLNRSYNGGSRSPWKHLIKQLTGATVVDGVTKDQRFGIEMQRFENELVINKYINEAEILIFKGDPATTGHSKRICIN